MARTWDGLPVAPDPPHGAAIIVWCRTTEGPRFLLLHRAHRDPDTSRDWAWGPPAGARLPGEEIAVCARRELEEETGIVAAALEPAAGTDLWRVYRLEVATPTSIRLSAEHDQTLWADARLVGELVWPARVQEPLLGLAQTLVAVPSSPAAADVHGEARV